MARKQGKRGGRRSSRNNQRQRGGEYAAYNEGESQLLMRGGNPNLSSEIKHILQNGGNPNNTGGAPGAGSVAAPGPVAAPVAAPVVLGGNGQISNEIMNQAKNIAENMLQNLGQKGGGGSPVALAGSELTGGMAAATGAATGAAPVVPPVVGSVGEVQGFQGLSGLQGSPLVGGSRSRLRRYGQKHSAKQRGGMMPGVMTAVETALVPLGLYLGQKALQSRRNRPFTSFRKRSSRRRNRK
jgi:hypothetical protein